ncbi:hypothetical protein [Mesorhizobium sp. M9A.F.Ca.ET.002.03.1.2]|uniref:hypothetical protein n=1 Tax=Mesorhizobium sp. M9A.F.Ca.ET.002.03.1.2 TaxID=2493668 RepID=UPI001FE16E7A|nr:hypothetical protein [Mesorhizobium sp. M9A.F.Ca.ET.002.03.1.2]
MQGVAVQAAAEAARQRCLVEMQIEVLDAAQALDPAPDGHSRRYIGHGKCPVVTAQFAPRSFDEKGAVAVHIQRDKEPGVGRNIIAFRLFPARNIPEVGDNAVPDMPFEAANDGKTLDTTFHAWGEGHFPFPCNGMIHSP